MKKLTKYFRNTSAIVVFILAISATGALAATFTVSNTNDGGAGSLRQAIIDANTAAGADTIVFGSLFDSPQIITVTAALVIDSGDNTATTITGPGANLLTVSGGNAVRVLEIRLFEPVTISGMTITGGNGISDTSPGNGGAVYLNTCDDQNACDTAPPVTFDQMVFTGNSATQGGAIASNLSRLVITNSTVTNNMATTTTPNTQQTGGGIFVTSFGSLTLINTTVSNNSAQTGGGGIFIDRASITLNNSTVTGNTATDGFGGGILTFTNREMNITNSVISNNTASGEGGGFFTQSTGAMTFTNTTITGNSAGNGGGGISFRAANNLTITGSTISNNIANPNRTNSNTGNGGGIAIRDSSQLVTKTISNSTISGNQARGPGGTNSGFGGGIFGDFTLSIDINNSTISGNVAERAFGGVFTEIRVDVDTTRSITNSTVVGNSAAEQGGGVSNSGDTLGPNSVFNLRNSIFANNTDNGTSPDLDGRFRSQGYNLIRSTMGATINGSTTGNITGVAPLLAPLADNGGATLTHALFTNSPAIDAADPASTLTVDQRGAMRPFNARADIGAFEVNPTFIAQLPNGTTGQNYNVTLVPNNGTTNYVVTGGTLPPGLMLTANFAPNAVIAITGTPTMSGIFNFAITGTNGANSQTTNYQINVLAPTAASVTVSGRVSDGKRGISDARVVLTDSNGATRTARTSSFGYYSFDDVEVGRTYTISVSSRRYSFATQVITVLEDLPNLNFTANSTGSR